MESHCDDLRLWDSRRLSAGLQVQMAILVPCFCHSFGKWQFQPCILPFRLPDQLNGNFGTLFMLFLQKIAISGRHFCYFPSNHWCYIVRSQPYAHCGKQVQDIYAETLPRTLTSYRMAWIKAHYRNEFHMARMIIARRRRKANMETKMIRLANLIFSITYT